MLHALTAGFEKYGTDEELRATCATSRTTSSQVIEQVDGFRQLLRDMLP